MAYTPTSWQNSPSTASPISAANLNNMESGIAVTQPIYINGNVTGANTDLAAPATAQTYFAISTGGGTLRSLGAAPANGTRYVIRNNGLAAVTVKHQLAGGTGSMFYTRNVGDVALFSGDAMDFAYDGNWVEVNRDQPSLAFLNGDITAANTDLASPNTGVTYFASSSTGGGTLRSIGAPQVPGSRYTLRLNGGSPVTIKHFLAGGTGLRLLTRIGGDVILQVSDVIEFVSDGSFWIEVNRDQATLSSSSSSGAGALQDITGPTSPRHYHIFNTASGGSLRSMGTPPSSVVGSTLSIRDSAGAFTIKHQSAGGAGQMFYTRTTADVVLSLGDSMDFIYDGSNWVEQNRDMAWPPGIVNSFSGTGANANTDLPTPNVFEAYYTFGTAGGGTLRSIGGPPSIGSRYSVRNANTLAVTIKNQLAGGTGSQLVLRGFADLALATGETIEFLHDGTFWTEQTRDVAVASSVPVTYRKITTKTVNTTVAATDLLNGEITVAAGAMGATGMLRLTAFGDFINNTGGGASAPRLQLILGGTTLLDTNATTNITNSAGRFAWELTAEILNLTASSQIVKMRRQQYGGGGVTGGQWTFTTGEGGGTTTGNGMFDWGVNSGLAVNTAVSAALVLNVINGLNNALYETKLFGAVVEII